MRDRLNSHNRDSITTWSNYRRPASGSVERSTHQDEICTCAPVLFVLGSQSLGHRTAFGMLGVHLTALRALSHSLLPNYSAVFRGSSDSPAAKC
ncbi:hypothetical protein RHA1_ro08946 (plasmid) [Rhodococcus jostii RHA1]|uniref:Uncharacterized protein n=1 Tax=Rhodococcus jostii (strain RHA1) TaxID=101510 RepID=Q0RXJ6_RHOJR|nr:hypothetical protein RHA1_ro08946 [Rhodococcus jostii RHA1]